MALRVRLHHPEALIVGLLGVVVQPSRPASVCRRAAARESAPCARWPFGEHFFQRPRDLRNRPARRCCAERSAGRDRPASAAQRRTRRDRNSAGLPSSRSSGRSSQKNSRRSTILPPRMWKRFTASISFSIVIAEDVGVVALGGGHALLLLQAVRRSRSGRDTWPPVRTARARPQRSCAAQATVPDRLPCLRGRGCTS